MKTHNQRSPYESPWSIREKVGMFLWQYAWAIFCMWTPKPLNSWRLFWLRRFGARLEGRPFVHQRARIQIPWNLTMRDRACLGDRANAYSLGEIEIQERATVAQEVYLCTGTHDFSDPVMPLQTAKITIGAGAFICARAFIMPGVTIGESAIIGACSVVTKDVPAGFVAVGNPAKLVGKT
jgi:putative colanic acid biosynthesis acetyltransferase WcaF